MPHLLYVQEGAERPNRFVSGLKYMFDPDHKIIDGSRQQCLSLLLTQRDEAQRCRNNTRQSYISESQERITAFEAAVGKDDAIGHRGIALRQCLNDGKELRIPNDCGIRC